MLTKCTHTYECLRMLGMWNLWDVEMKHQGLKKKKIAQWAERAVRNQETAGLWDCAAVPRKDQSQETGGFDSSLCMNLSGVQLTSQAQGCRV